MENDQQFPRGKTILPYNLHRISAAGMIAYILVHFVFYTAIKFRVVNAIPNESTAIRFLLVGIESLLLLCVFYHGINGLRMILADLVFTSWWQPKIFRRSQWIVLLLTLLLWFPLLIWMFLRLSGAVI